MKPPRRDTSEIREFTKIQELAYELRVGEAMARDPVTISPEATLKDLRELLRSRRISGVPVSEGGHLIGLISIEDFINALAQGEMSQKVSEFMTRDVKVLFEDDSLVRAVEMFERRGFGRFPVLDRSSGKLVGILTKGNIVEGLLKRLEVDYHEEEVHKYRASHFFEDIVADRTTLIFHYGVKGKDFSRAGQASSGLKKTLSRLGLSPTLIRRVAIAAYEAEMNMVIYAENGRITAEVTPETVRVTAADVGPGIKDVNQALEPGWSTASDWVREMGFGAGMGLPNIKKCSDHMVLHSTPGKGTTVEFMVMV